MKTLKISDETHQKLMIIKISLKAKTFDKTIKELIEDHEYANFMAGIKDDK